MRFHVAHLFTACQLDASFDTLPSIRSLRYASLLRERRAQGTALCLPTSVFGLRTPDFLLFPYL